MQILKAVIRFVCWIPATLLGLLLLCETRRHLRLLLLIAQAVILYGFALIIVGPFVVRVAELPWHFLALLCAFVATAISHWFKGDAGPDAEPSQQEISANDDASVAPNAIP